MTDRFQDDFKDEVREIAKNAQLLAGSSYPSFEEDAVVNP